MGTNYYVLKRMKYEKGMPSSLGCCVDENEVEELKNGYLFNNTYYPTIEELSKRFYQKIHVGKASMGWHFSLCIYPEYGINNFNDWKKLFSDSNVQIEDEYGDIISPEVMIEKITKRSISNWDDNPEAIKDFEAHCLQIQNSFRQCTGSKAYDSYDEYLEVNHAQRGNNGLLKHKLDKFHIENPDKTATYDYIISGNDPEKGVIFV
jgi:hypothetical protein